MSSTFNPGAWESAPRADISTSPAAPAPDPTKPRKRPAKAKAEPAAAAPVAAATASPLGAGAAPEAPAFVGGAPRTLTLSLAYPLAYAGRLFTAITLRRPTADETELFLERLRSGAGSTGLPIFFDADGLPIPPAVLDALDPDDDEDLYALVPGFVPRRWQRLLQD